MREHFDGMYLSHDAAKGVIETYGMDRDLWFWPTPSSCKDWDGRFSPANKEWAKTWTSPTTTRTVRRQLTGYALNSHPWLVELFFDPVREEHLRLQPLTPEEIQAEAARLCRSFVRRIRPTAPTAPTTWPAFRRTFWPAQAPRPMTS